MTPREEAIEAAYNAYTTAIDAAHKATHAAHAAYDDELERIDKEYPL